jgi:hypothetical protein
VPFIKFAFAFQVAAAIAFATVAFMAEISAGISDPATPPGRAALVRTLWLS